MEEQEEEKQLIRKFANGVFCGANLQLRNLRIGMASEQYKRAGFLVKLTILLLTLLESTSPNYPELYR